MLLGLTSIFMGSVGLSNYLSLEEKYLRIYMATFLFYFMFF